MASPSELPAVTRESPRRSRVGGLDEQRQPELRAIGQHLVATRAPGGTAHRWGRDDGQLGLREKALNHVLGPCPPPSRGRPPRRRATPASSSRPCTVRPRPSGMQHGDNDVDRGPGGAARRVVISAGDRERSGAVCARCGARVTSRRSASRRARRGSREPARAAPPPAATSARSCRCPPHRLEALAVEGPTTKRAESSEISCSAERPPKSTATRSLRGVTLVGRSLGDLSEARADGVHRHVAHHVPVGELHVDALHHAVAPR